MVAEGFCHHNLVEPYYSLHGECKMQPQKFLRWKLGIM